MKSLIASLRRTEIAICNAMKSADRDEQVELLGLQIHVKQMIARMEAAPCPK